MATPKGLTTRKKKTVRAAPIRRGRKVVGPDFTGWETWTGKEFHLFKTKAKAFYYENMQEADLLPDVWLWMKNNGYTADQIKSAKSAKGWNGITANIAISCKLLNTGCPDYNELENAYWQTLAGTTGDVWPLSRRIREKLEIAIEAGKAEVAAEVDKEEKTSKKIANIPSIQERVRETAFAMTEDIELAIDSFIMKPDDFNPNDYKIAAMLRGKQAKAAHARIIKSYYQPQLAEYSELISPGCDKDLMEGHSVYGKKNIKKMFDFLSQLDSACDQIVGESKILKKPRKIKVKSAEDQVKKVKFKATDDKYGVASVSPAQIVGAAAVVVFNTKTRKIGVYYADSTAQVLGIKGSTIVGFDTKQSNQKTMRKPDVQLKEFKAIGTLKRTQVWFNDIKTTSTVLNGRINSDVMILKVYK